MRIGDVDSCLIQGQFDPSHSAVDNPQHSCLNIELNPNYPTGHAWYGLYLEALGRHEESLAERKRASDLDPLNVKLSWGPGSAFYHTGQDDKAIEIYQKAIGCVVRYRREDSGKVALSRTENT